MAFDFPAVPTVGQVYQGYTWDGEKWTLAVGSLVGRELLTAPRSYYVRTDGSDSNNGLSNTAGGAFLTIQKALNVVYGTLDLGGQAVTINLADGTYSGAVATQQSSPQTGAGTISLIGNVASPGNVIITNTADNTFIFFNSTIVINGCEIRNGAGSYGVIARSRAYVSLGNNVRLGAVGAAQVYANQFATISLGATAIVGGGTAFARAGDSAVVVFSGQTMTLTGTPAFSQGFVVATGLSQIAAQGVTFSGAATGPRFLVEKSSLIDTAGSAEASYFPGTTAGVKQTQGIYV